MEISDYKVLIKHLIHYANERHDNFLYFGYIVLKEATVQICQMVYNNAQFSRLVSKPRFYTDNYNKKMDIRKKCCRFVYTIVVHKLKNKKSMFPIQEQGHQKGIGHGYDSFLRKFIEICENHLKNERAKSFAFILYDFNDKQIRQILKNQGGFARLDRLSSSELSIFYIHSDNKKLIKAFNRIFIEAFEIKNTAKLPCVMFFKMDDGDVEDLQIVELEQTDKMFAFEELYSTIESYLKDSKNIHTPKKNKLTEFLGKVKNLTVEEFIKWVIEQGIQKAENMY